MTRSLTDFLRRYAREQDGVISVMAVGALVLALAVAMVVVDTGAMLSAYRNQQAATDAAALGAVRQIAEAQNVAETIFNLNEFEAGDMVATPLYYVADPARAPDDRFFTEGQTASDGTVVSESSFNAVRVAKRSQSPTYFARLFGFGNLTQIDTEAVAAYTKYVSFSAGTRVADANLGRQVFSGLLGIDVGLINYESLAAANVDAIPFLDALAIQVGADTYSELLNTEVEISDLSFALTALDNSACSGDCAYARNVFVSLTAGGTSVPLNKILNAAPIADRAIGITGSSLRDPQIFNVLDLLSGTAMAMGEGRAVAVELTGGLSPIVSVSGSLTVGSAMAHMAMGRVGDRVHTAQVELNLTVTVLPILGLPIEVDIPIEVAPGTAEVSSIPCREDGTKVSLTGTTGIVSGLVSLGSTSHPNVTFSESEFGTAKQVSSVLSLQAALGGLLSAVVPLEALEDFINSLLTTLGVKLGAMDMIVHGAKCRAPTLVS